MGENCNWTVHFTIPISRLVNPICRYIFGLLSTAVRIQLFLPPVMYGLMLAQPIKGRRLLWRQWFSIEPSVFFMQQMASGIHLVRGVLISACSIAQRSVCARSSSDSVAFWVRAWSGVEYGGGFGSGENGTGCGIGELRMLVQMFYFWFIWMQRQFSFLS